MPDRLFFAVSALAAAAMIGLALVWPQGYGARSPGPFGSLPVQQRPEVKAAMQRQHDAATLREAQAKAGPPAADQTLRGPQ